VEVVEKAELHIIDSIAAAVSGTELEAGRLAFEFASSNLGPRQATLFGSGLQTSIPYAAMANGMAAHADETDDSLPPLGSIRTHPGCSVVPSAVAVAEAKSRSGMELIRAVTLGYEICSRFAMALWSDYEAAILEKSSVAVANVFGSAAAATSLLSLGEKQVRYVFSHAVQHAAGLNSFFRERRHVEKAYVFGGMPSFNGTSIALMVSQGWTGVEDVFVGDPSFFSLGPRPDPGRLTVGLGSDYELMRTRLKKYPVGSPIQSPVDALLEILHTQQLDHSDVAEVEVRLSPPRFEVCHDRHMSSLNIEYLIEVALLDGSLTFENSHDEARFQRWRASGPDPRVAIRPDGEFGAGHGASVKLSTYGGDTYTCTVDDIPGSARNPLSRDEVELKATTLMAPVLGERRTAGLIADLRDLRNLDSIQQLQEWLLVP
jgi:2-methylcitrate dehydratase PrpD